MDMSFDEIMKMIGSGSGDTEMDNSMFGAGNMRHTKGPLDASGMGQEQSQGQMNPAMAQKALGMMGSQGESGAQQTQQKPMGGGSGKTVSELARANNTAPEQQALLFNTVIPNTLMPDDNEDF